MDGFLAIILLLLAVSIAGNLARVQDENETKRIQKMSAKELENRLVELLNIALSIDLFHVSESERKTLEAITKESEKIVAELKEKTGRDYKDVSALRGEMMLAHFQAAKSGTIELTKPSAGNASVVKRAIVGGVIAGPAGAVVGAISAADQNNRNK